MAFSFSRGNGSFRNSISTGKLFHVFEINCFIAGSVSGFDIYSTRAAPLAAVQSMIEWVGACFLKKVMSGCHVREIFAPQRKSEVSFL